MKQFAIIGCGSISRRHAENMIRHGQLAAVCDTVPEKANGLAAKYTTKPYYSIDELLANEKEIDLVAVCSPNGFHAEHIIKSLQAGKDVLTEKPLCLTTAAAWQIIETEKFCRQRLFVVKSARYNPILQQLQSIVKEGKLGKLYSFHLNCIWNRPLSYYTDWKGKLFPDGGTLFNQFSHYIDSILWLFGEVADVKGFRANLAHPSAMEFEDNGVAAFMMKNGMVGSLHWTVNAFEKNHELALTIVAEKGTIKIGGEYLNDVQYVHTSNPVSLSSFAKDSINSHRIMYDDLMKALNNKQENFPNAYDGLRTVDTIEKIYKATSQL